jgi:dTDP-4-amino-4,6-dideoxygalactose transaminase
VIPFLDLEKQQVRIRQRIDAGIQKVLDHGNYILGPEVKLLEKLLAEYVGVREAVSCASGTDALLLSLMACGVKPGDPVLTTAFSFIAGAEVIALLGAVPVFVDIDAETFNMAPEGLEKALKALAAADAGMYPLPEKVLKSRIRPKGIITVDLFGLPSDYDRIHAIAKEYDLFVIEDGAQSFGAAYKGKKAGALADIGCTSFFPAKPLGCYGDGGMCFTDDRRMAEIMRSLRSHGKGTDKYENVRIGTNSRLDTIQAAILIEKFAIFEDELQSRRKIASRYSELLRDSPLVATPNIPVGSESAWAQYSVLAGGKTVRAQIMDALANHQVPTAIYYPLALHLQGAFRMLGYKEGDFAVSETVSERIFSLPFHPYLEYEVQKKITDVIASLAPVRSVAAG